MRLGPGTLVLLVGAGALAASASPQKPPVAKTASPAAATSPSPRATPGASPSPSPSPSPLARLLPYWYETPEERSMAPLLRFEDRAEVRALEMNAAIARFFDPTDDKGDMLRGATPGGAPTLDEMRNYRPHVSPAADFLSLAMWAAQGIKGGFRSRNKSRVERNEELLRALLLGEDPSPTPTPAPSLTPAPSPTPRG